MEIFFVIPGWAVGQFVPLDGVSPVDLGAQQGPGSRVERRWGDEDSGREVNPVRGVPACPQQGKHLRGRKKGENKEKKKKKKKKS